MIDHDPKPDVMPIDREAWARELHLSNFVNSYYQFRDLQSLQGIRRVLIVGPGQGLDTVVLRWRGYEVVTVDIDATFGPDVVGSVDNLDMFADQAFDAVIASHVIEHLPLAYLDRALSELARVARFALVYLPTAGRPAELRLSPGVFGWRWALTLQLFNWFAWPDPVRPRFCGGQHYFEVGRAGFSPRSLARRFAPHFKVLKLYRNPDWLWSFNFVLQAKTQGTP